MRWLNVRLGRAGSWQQGSQMGCQGVGAGEEGSQALGLIFILRPSGTPQPGISGAEGEAAAFSPLLLQLAGLLPTTPSPHDLGAVPNLHEENKDPAKHPLL